MARNEEKAQAMLNRWWTMKRSLTTKPLETRPSLSQEVNSINECEKWRQQIIREISKKVSTIQNAGLGEHRIRDLNDEINKLLREKYHWEERIRELGGADYRKSNSKIVDSQGLELPGSGGYKYFGAAKDLPGVRELFQKEVPQAPTKNRVDLYKIITYDYYGHLERENEYMIEQERALEEKYDQEELNKWVEANAGLLKRRFKGRNVDEIEVSEILEIINENEKQETFEVKDDDNLSKKEDVVEKAREDELLKRKNEILKKYFNETMRNEDEEEKIIKDLIVMNEEL